MAINEVVRHFSNVSEVLLLLQELDAEITTETKTN